MELGYAPGLYRVWGLHGYPVALEVLYRFQASAGYELIRDDSIVARVGVGSTTDPALVFNAGLGVKLW